jgi:hypothetical protein
MTKEKMLAEAYRRGILPSDMATKYEEAQKRGLIGSKPAEQPQSASQRVAEDIKRSSGIPSEVLSYGSELGVSDPAAVSAIGETLSNVPRSAAHFAESVAQPILHPVETAENIGRIGKGVMQKLGVISGKDATQYADAVGKALVDRYGSKDAILKTIVVDPVGIAADVATVLSAGGSLAVRAPGLLRMIGADTGRAGEAVAAAGRGVSAVGNAVNPLSVVTPVAKLGGKVASEALGVTTGAGGESIRTAAQAGAEGGQAGKAFLENLRDQVPAEEVVSDAKAAVANLRQQRGDLYRQEMAKMDRGQYKILDFADIDAAVDNTVKKFKSVSISPSVEALQNSIREVVNEWKGFAPAQYHTAEGLDALKQRIGDIRDNTQYGTPQRLAADKVYNAIKGTIVKQAPEYADIMKGYQTASEQIKEIEKTLSVNPKASIDTALRKITSALRDNVNTNYGKRKELVGFLARSGATHLLQKIAGQALKSVAPRGLARVLAGGEGATALALAGTNPIIAAKLAAATGMSSPRLVGEAAFKAGQASRFPFRKAGLASRLVGGAGQ